MGNEYLVPIFRFFQVIFAVTLLATPLHADKKSETIVKNLIKKFTGMKPAAVADMKTIFELEDQMKKVDKHHQKLLRKDIDRLMLLVLKKSLEAKHDHWKKIDRIRDLAGLEGTIEFSEFFSRMLLQDALELYKRNSTITEQEFLRSGVLGAIGRNPTLSDNFLSKVVQTIMDLPAKASKSPAKMRPTPPRKSPAGAIQYGFERLRNLKSLAKNDQASGKFLTSLVETIFSLKRSVDIDAFKAVIKEYLLPSKNLTHDLRERLSKLVD